MVRIQIQLDPSRHRELKRQARRLGVSVAELIRRSIDAAFRADRGDSRDTVIRRALAAAGRYRDPSGRSDVARRHDPALADAYRR